MTIGKTNINKEKIYLISHPEGFHKIGVSTNPENRVRNLSTATPYSLTLENVILVEGGSAFSVEGVLHESLDKYNVSGEWFELPHSARMFLAQADIFKGRSVILKRFEWETSSDYAKRRGFE